MTTIGYAAMLEQFHPTDLLDWAEQAEGAGFSAGFQVSEHFHPWTPQQGQSAFAWSFMGALGERTTLPFGTAVTCPGFRYHPAVIAHAAATLCHGEVATVVLFCGATVMLGLMILAGVRWQSEHKDVEVMVLRDISRSADQVRNFPAPAPSACPECTGRNIAFRGVGTEQVERAVEEAFPAARIAFAAATDPIERVSHRLQRVV